jgi:DNA-directed RNA polymerase specialized sigma24 family protein
MLDNPFIVSDICIEVIETADRYMKAVLINTKKRYFRVLRKHERNGITVFELEKYESNLAHEENGFTKVDSEYFVVGNELFALEKSELTEALLLLTPIQRDVLLKSVLLEKSQEELAAEYAITKRMIRKHKHLALEKLRRRLAHET